MRLENARNDTCKCLTYIHTCKHEYIYVYICINTYIDKRESKKELRPRHLAKPSLLPFRTKSRLLSGTIKNLCTQICSLSIPRCFYTYMCIFILMYIFICICIYMHICKYIYIYVYAFETNYQEHVSADLLSLDPPVFIYVPVYIYTHVYIYICICICLHIHMYVYICV